MADVSAIFGILLSLGIAFPGMLAALRLLFPVKVARARARVETSPWQCFWLGTTAAVLLSIPIIILYALPLGPAKLVASLVLAALLTFASTGAAGIAELMAARISRSVDAPQPGLLRFLQAAVILELAAVFPMLGWLFILPLAILVSLGASVFALFGASGVTAAAKAASPAVIQEAA